MTRLMVRTSETVTRSICNYMMNQLGLLSDPLKLTKLHANKDVYVFLSLIKTISIHFLG